MKRIWNAACEEIRREDFAGMGEIAARAFVIGFLLVYAVLLAALVGWNLRNWLRRLVENLLPQNILEHFRHLPFLHRPRNGH
jgi:hypothetical protein